MLPILVSVILINKNSNFFRADILSETFYLTKLVIGTDDLVISAL